MNVGTIIMVVSCDVFGHLVSDVTVQNQCRSLTYPPAIHWIRMSLSKTMAALSLTRAVIMHMHAQDPIRSRRRFAEEDEEVVDRHHRDHERAMSGGGGGRVGWPVLGFQHNCHFNCMGQPHGKDQLIVFNQTFKGYLGPFFGSFRLLIVSLFL